MTGLGLVYERKRDTERETERETETERERGGVKERKKGTLISLEQA